MMKAVIFAGAEIKDYGFCQKYISVDTMIVCCDSGLRHAKALGITPHAMVGDFDSVDEETFEFFKNKGVEIIKFPSHKDETDLELGLDYALNKGAKDITVFGAIGSRMDHTLANCHYLLYLLEKGVMARLVDEKNEVFLIDKSCILKGGKGDLVSLIPLSMEVKGISTKGLEYSLKDDVLKLNGRLIAVSNVMTEEKAEIEIKEGFLFVMRCSD